MALTRHKDYTVSIRVIVDMSVSVMFTITEKDKIYCDCVDWLIAKKTEITYKDHNTIRALHGFGLRHPTYPNLPQIIRLSFQSDEKLGITISERYDFWILNNVRLSRFFFYHTINELISYLNEKREMKIETVRLP